MATARAVHPELPLVVVSAAAPSAGEWIRYRTVDGFARSFCQMRAALGGRRIELALVMLQARTPYRKLQGIGFLMRARRRLAVNENLDYFEVRWRSAGIVLRHLGWRWREWRQRRQPFLPAVWWARAAGFAIGLSKRGSGGIPLEPAACRPAGISVVIPSRNGREMLERMLPAVLEQPGASEVIVVNNGSQDGSAEFLRRHFPAVILSDHEAPLAFPAAVNMGLRAARFSHVCLLNNDMAVAPGFLQALRRAFDRVPGLFCAAAQVFLPPGLPRQETGKTFLRADPAIADFPVRCDPPIEHEDLSYVLYGSSGCSLYDGARLEALGGLDEVYSPAYVEDLDLGVRAWQQGWPSVFVAEARVVHEHRATMSRLYSEDQLEGMVAGHWLLFLARTLRERTVFARYWRHAVARLGGMAARGSGDAKQLLKHVGVAGQWRTRGEGTVLADGEIFALCAGSVAVFPGAQAETDEPVLLEVRSRLDELSSAADRCRRVVVALVDRLGPVPSEALAICAEIVAVECSPAGDAETSAFHAALRQTLRKWKPERVVIEAALGERCAADCAWLAITIPPRSPAPPPCRLESTAE